MIGQENDKVFVMESKLEIRLGRIIIPVLSVLLTTVHCLFEQWNVVPRYDKIAITGPPTRPVLNEQLPYSIT